MTCVQTYDISSVSFLVVEPNKNMQMILKQVLRSFGVKDVRIMSDSGAALKEVNNSPPDIVMTEMRASPMSGFDLVRSIPTDPESAAPYLPVIMLTGYTEAQHVYRARDTGVSEFLTKPVTPLAIFKRMVALIERPRPFIKAGEYFGPDRRRSNTSTWQGEDRRGAPHALQR